MKIAVIGANGQVGAEVVLRLQGVPGLEAVPICRHSGGSAFLRYHGVACRHGLPADPAQASRLFGDCDVVANFAISGGTPAQATKSNRAMIANSIAASPKHAVILYFSTLAVYGDPILGRTIGLRTSYGREKLRAERYAMKLGRRHGKPVYVLRLGHVLGALQAISGQIRDEIAVAKDIPWAGGGKSNTTHTVTIADAIAKIAAGIIATPGVYDLVNFPQWSWAEVYADEARAAGLTFVPSRSATVLPPKSGTARELLRRITGLFSGSTTVREIGLRLAARLPLATNQWLQARHFRARALAEIAALTARMPATEAVNWREFPETRLKGLTPTHELIAQNVYCIADGAPAKRWPADLAPAPV